MAGAWWSSEEEFRFFESICVVILCALAEFFDTLKNALQAWVLQHDHQQKHSDVAAFYGTLFARGSSELMVLGFLAFCVWTTSRTGGFDAIVAALPSESSCGDSKDYKLRALAAASDACRRMLAEKPSDAYESGTTENGREPFNYPPKGSDLLHVVEDVHMQMFCAMLLYFIIMSMGITYAKHMCERWHWWEEEMSAYMRFPRDENIASWRRLLNPLTDVKDFFKVKLFFVSWAQAGGLRHVEQKRARELAREQQRVVMGSSLKERAADSLRRRSLFGADDDAKSRVGPAARRAGSDASGVDGASSANDLQRTAPRRESVASSTLGAELEPPRKPKGVDVRITERFHFAEYLTFCFAELLEELIEFRMITWGFVMTLAAIEAVSMWFGVRFVVIDIAYTSLTIAVLLFMWGVAKVFSRDVIKAAERADREPALADGTVRFGKCFSAAFEKVSQNFHVEVHFLRVLQAITWRNLFRVAEFFLGPTFRTFVSSGTSYFLSHDGPLLVVLTGVVLCSSLLLPIISFDWGLAMFLPPHLDDRNVEVAELVCWRQKHPLESFTAPWEQGLDHIATGDGGDVSIAPTTQSALSTSSAITSADGHAGQRAAQQAV